MVKYFRRLAFALIAVAATRQLYLMGCPWSSTEIVTTFSRHPDIPRTKYVGGNIGVLLPSYATSYQVIAYRYFEGIGMTPGEQSQANLYFRDKLEWQKWDIPAPDWMEEWDRLADQYTAVKQPPVEPEKQNPQTRSYELNCADDAFRVATFTLRDRLKRAGAKSQFFQSWLEAQNAVFSNCGGERGQPIPPLPLASPQWLKQDRLYQTGARYFYRGEQVEAIRTFRLVAADSASPWRNLARYLIVRAMTRNVQRDEGKYPEVAREIEAILRDQRLQSIHSAVRVLRRRNLLIAKPEQTLAELSGALSSRGVDLSLRQDLWDFVHLFSPMERNRATAKLAKLHVLPDWLSTLQQPDAASAEYARGQWQKSNSAAWLAAAISNSIASDPDVDSLLEAAGKINEQHAAFLTMAYHRARILCEFRRYDEASSIVETCLMRKDLGHSGRNLFAMLRGQTVIDLREFLTNLPRKPVLVHSDWDSAEIGLDELTPKEAAAMRKQYLAYADAQALNHRTPLKMLAELALGEDLPDGLSIELRRVALMRSLILEQSDLYRPLAVALARSAPTYRSRLSAALVAEDGELLRDALLQFTIQQPEFRAHFLKSGSDWLPAGKLTDSRDDFWHRLRDNDTLSFEQEGGWAKCVSDSQAPAPLNYKLLEAGAEQAKKEWAVMSEAGPASHFYLRFAFDYHAKHSSDSGAANLLGAAVRVWNNSTREDEDFPLAVKTWRLLQTRYPKSTWSARYKRGVMGPNYTSSEAASPKDAKRNHFPGVRCRFKPWE